MAAGATLESRSREPLLLWWCIAASLVAHVLMLKLLPGWYIVTNPPPAPLTVELIAPPAPERVPVKPPEPLPRHTQPVPQERLPRTMPKPVVRPNAEKPLAQPPVAPVLSAAPEVLPAPTVSVAPEQSPAPPSAQLTEAPRPTRAPAPARPPRFDATYLNNPRPLYPLAARRRGDQGTVLVRVLVTAEGAAASVGIEKTSGHSALDEAALIAVKSWRFVPARQGGQAIETPYVVPIVFRID